MNNLELNLLALSLTPLIVLLPQIPLVLNHGQTQKSLVYA